MAKLLDMATATDDAILSVRLDASRVAQERSRLALFATTVIALALVTGAWNAHLSFYRTIAFEFKQLSGGDGTQALQKEVLTAWARNRMINVSLLGLNVGVDDAPTLGAMATIVALVWFYFVIRRENHAIGRLLLDYQESPRDVRWRIFHGINSYTVFSNVGQSDAPIDVIHGKPPDLDRKPVWILRKLSHHIFYLSFYALAFLVILEFWSYFRTSPFRPDDKRWVITLL